MNNNRVVSIDVLRSLSMFFVVVSHYIYHGIKPRAELHGLYSFDTLAGGGNFLSMNALYIMSCVAVNCFVMISGYFLIEKMSYRWKGILKIWVETFFYSVSFLFLSMILGRQIVANDIIISFLPIWGQRYWFMTFYIGLMLLAPLLSRAVVNLSEKQYMLVLLLLFILNFQYLYGGIFGGFASLMWFSFLFLVGGFIKKYGCHPKIIKNKGRLLIGMWGVLTLMAFVINILKGGQTTLVSTSYHGPIFFLSLSVFIFFASTDMHGRLVSFLSKMAPYTLAVYLIHANSFWGERLWDLFIPNTFVLPMFFYCLGGCFIIFFVSIAIDVFREEMFKLFKINNVVEKISSRLPLL